MYNLALNVCRVLTKGRFQRIERSKKYLTHDENGGMSCFQHRSIYFVDTRGVVLRINDEVLIRNCPPISARKRFALDQVLRSPETQHEFMHRDVVTNSQPPARWKETGEVSPRHTVLTRPRLRVP